MEILKPHGKGRSALAARVDPEGGSPSAGHPAPGLGPRASTSDVTDHLSSAHFTFPPFFCLHFFYGIKHLKH